MFHRLPARTDLIIVASPGPDPDSAKAILIAAVLHAQRHVRLRAVVTNGGQQARERARLARCLLDHVGVLDVPVGVGSAGLDVHAPAPYEYALPGLERVDDARLHEDGQALLERSLRRCGHKACRLVLLSSMADVAALVERCPALLLARTHSLALVGGLARAQGQRPGVGGSAWVPDSAVNNWLDMGAAEAVYGFCFAKGVPMSVVSRDAVPLLPMQLTRSFAHRSGSALLGYLADAQWRGLQALWERLAQPGRLPERCTREWFCATFCRADDGAAPAPSLPAEITDALSGHVRPSAVLALMAALPSAQHAFATAPQRDEGAPAAHRLLLERGHAVGLAPVLALLRHAYHEAALRTAQHHASGGGAAGAADADAADAGGVAGAAGGGGGGGAAGGAGGRMGLWRMRNAHTSLPRAVGGTVRGSSLLADASLRRKALEESSRSSRSGGGARAASAAEPPAADGARRSPHVMPDAAAPSAARAEVAGAWGRCVLPDAASGALRGVPLEPAEIASMLQKASDEARRHTARGSRLLIVSAQCTGLVALLVFALAYTPALAFLPHDVRVTLGDVMLYPLGYGLALSCLALSLRPVRAHAVRLRTVALLFPAAQLVLTNALLPGTYLLGLLGRTLTARPYADAFTAAHIPEHPELGRFRRMWLVLSIFVSYMLLPLLPIAAVGLTARAGSRGLARVHGALWSFLGLFNLLSASFIATYLAFDLALFGLARMWCVECQAAVRVRPWFSVVRALLIAQMLCTARVQLSARLRLQLRARISRALSTHGTLASIAPLLGFGCAQHDERDAVALAREALGAFAPLPLDGPARASLEFWLRPTLGAAAGLDAAEWRAADGAHAPPRPPRAGRSRAAVAPAEAVGASGGACAKAGAGGGAGGGGGGGGAVRSTWAASAVRTPSLASLTSLASLASLGSFASASAAASESSKRSSIVPAGAGHGSFTSSHASSAQTAPSADGGRRAARRSRPPLPRRPFSTQPAAQRAPADAQPADAFCVHCADDGAAARAAAIGRWAERFEAARGVAPRVWLDVACADVSLTPRELLEHVPAYMARCRSLLLVCSARTPDCLTCVLQLHTWLATGGQLADVEVELTQPSARARRELVGALEAFHVMFAVGSAPPSTVRDRAKLAAELATVGGFNSTVRAYIGPVERASVRHTPRSTVESLADEGEPAPSPASSGAASAGAAFQLVDMRSVRVRQAAHAPAGDDSDEAAAAGAEPRPRCNA